MMDKKARRWAYKYKAMGKETKRHYDGFGRRRKFYKGKRGR